MKKILALTGPKSAGKTFFASALVRKNYIFREARIFSFSDPVRSMLRIILPPEAFTSEGKNDPCFGLCGKSPKNLMEMLSLDWGRRCVSDSLWREIMKKRIETAVTNTIIIDDLMFDDEAEMLSLFGASIFNVVREGVGFSKDPYSAVPISPFFLRGQVDLSQHPQIEKSDFLYQFDPFDSGYTGYER